MKHNMVFVTEQSCTDLNVKLFHTPAISLISSRDIPSSLCNFCALWRYVMALRRSPSVCKIIAFIAWKEMFKYVWPTVQRKLNYQIALLLNTAKQEIWKIGVLFTKPVISLTVYILVMLYCYIFLHRRIIHVTTEKVYQVVIFYLYRFFEYVANVTCVHELFPLSPHTNKPFFSKVPFETSRTFDTVPLSCTITIKQTLLYSDSIIHFKDFSKEKLMILLNSYC